MQEVVIHAVGKPTEGRCLALMAGVLCALLSNCAFDFFYAVSLWNIGFMLEAVRGLGSILLGGYWHLCGYWRQGASCALGCCLGYIPCWGLMFLTLMEISGTFALGPKANLQVSVGGKENIFVRTSYPISASSQTELLPYSLVAGQVHVLEHLGLCRAHSSEAFPPVAAFHLRDSFP